MEHSSFFDFLNNELINYNSNGERISLPLSIQLELTSLCNMHCKYCYNSSGVKDNNELSIDQWIIVLNKIIELGGIFQCTFSGGEPLLFPNLNILMDTLYKDGTSFNLITNGCLLNEEQVIKFKKYNWNWIQISLDSQFAEIHDYVRGYAGGWEKAVNGIKILVANNMPVHVACVVTKYNLYNLKEFVSFCKSIGVTKIRFSEVLFSGRACDGKLLLTAEEKDYLKKTIDELILYNKKEQDIKIEIATSYREQLTNLKKYAPLSIIIRPNGDVKIDCVLPFVIGNVKEESLSKIWQNVYSFYDSKIKNEYIDNALQGEIKVKNNFDPDIVFKKEVK